MNNSYIYTHTYCYIWSSVDNFCKHFPEGGDFIHFKFGSIYKFFLVN